MEGPLVWAHDQGDSGAKMVELAVSDPRRGFG